MDTTPDNLSMKDKDVPHVFLDEPSSRDILNALLEDIPTFTYTSTFTEKSRLSSEFDEL